MTSSSRALAGLVLLGAVLAALPGAAKSRPGPGVLVKLRAEGPHAVEDCAQRLHERAEPLSSATRDGSDSLDRIQADLGVRGVRALFRRDDGRPFAVQRRALAARAQRRRHPAPTSAQSALPTPPDLSHVYRLELAPGQEPRAAAARLAADPHVAWAQADFEVDLDFEADDPFLFSSGSWGQDFGDLWGIHQVRAPEAWPKTRGEGVVVAIVDTGVDLEHPDLAANAWLNAGEDLDSDGRVTDSDRNGVDDDGNGFIDDFHGFDFANSIDANQDGDYLDAEDLSDADPFDDIGHGTHVAGTVAAVANNGIGVAGVAPAARIMALKGFRPGESSTIEILSQGMVYAVLNGARVINNSWSCSQRCPSNPLAEEVSAFAAALGVVVVTSAGNRRDDVVFYSPENQRTTLAVGASDPDGQPLFFTNGGLGVDVVAPGGASAFNPRIRLSQRAILSTLSSGAGTEASGDGAFVVGEEYARWSGTSMSAPHVAGIAALLLSQRPELSVEEVRALIRNSATDLGTPGPDASTGMGRADAAAAIAAVPPPFRLRFSEPRVGSTLVPDEERIRISGAIEGDFASAELAAGFGSDPNAFDRIADLGASPFEGTLAHWEVAELQDGPYVLRLRAVDSEGVEGVEFLSMAIERNRPVRISPEGVSVGRPAVSRPWVAWEQDAEEEEAEEGDPREIFVRRWSGGEAWRAAGGPGAQRLPRLAGSRLVWLDGKDPDTQISSCRLRGREPRCHPERVTPDRAARFGTALAGNRLVWSEVVAGLSRLRGCRLWAGRCRPLALPTGEGSQTRAFLGPQRLSWSNSGPDRVLSCPGFPRACHPIPVETHPSAVDFAGGGELLVQLGIGNPKPLWVCRIREDGTCPPSLAGAVGLGEIPAVSGQRVVWSGPGPAGDADIHVCDYDRLADRCLPQRLTGSAADQRRPAVSGNRVVWEDDREGDVAIFGLELPWLAPVSDRRVRAGKRVQIRVRGRDPSGSPLEVAAELGDGRGLAELGMRFESRRDGSGWLRWRPDRSQVGRHAIRLTGRGVGGLVARRTFEIEVLDSRPGRARWQRPTRR